jgi:hypothetical protein
MPTSIKWARNSIVEDFLNHEGYAWTYDEAVPLKRIDIKGASTNPIRPFLRFDQGNADGILLSMIDGIAIPPIVVCDIGDPMLEVNDGVHRLDAATYVAKNDGTQTVAAYIVTDASPRRRNILSARLNINQGRQLSDEERLSLAIQWLKDGTCETPDEASRNVGLDPKRKEVATRWKLEQILERAIKLGVGNIFRDRILENDGKDFPAAQAFALIQNDVLFALAVVLTDKFEMNIKEMVGLARTVADTRSEHAGKQALEAADAEFTERDARNAQRSKGKPKLSRGKKYFMYLGKADNVGPVSRFGLDGEVPHEVDRMLAVLDRVDKKNAEAKKWLLRLKEEQRKVEAAKSASQRGASPSASTLRPA